MSSNPELRDFLRSRRARLTPAAAGADPGPGPRRVPGLRREEVARLVGVSVDYYTRFEQGRAGNVSADVIGATAAALQLDPHERAYLFSLAGNGDRAGAPAEDDQPEQELRPGIRVLLDALATPAFVVGMRLEVLATNPMARALLCDFDSLPVGERNHARWVFLDPEARSRYLDWEAVARDNVAALRMQTARYPADLRLVDLIEELQTRSPEFAAWWEEIDVTRQEHGTKRYRHPVVGDLIVSYEALPISDAAEQTLFIYTAEPGSPSAEALDRLAELAAE